MFISISGCLDSLVEYLGRQSGSLNFLSGRLSCVSAYLESLFCPWECLPYCLDGLFWHHKCNSIRVQWCCTHQISHCLSACFIYFLVSHSLSGECSIQHLQTLISMHVSSILTLVLFLLQCQLSVYCWCKFPLKIKAHPSSYVVLVHVNWSWLT